MNVRFLLAEDHALYRAGLKQLLTCSALFEDSSIEECGDFEGVMTRLQAQNLASIQLLLLDLQMPGTTGLNGVTQIRRQFPLLPIIVISSLELGFKVQQVMSLGVNGFFSKSITPESMLTGIEHVLAGEIITLLGHECEASDVHLNARQSAILNLIAVGYSNKEISAELGIAVTTVRDYVSEILRLLDVKNRTQAAQKAQKLGITDLLP